MPDPTLPTDPISAPRGANPLAQFLNVLGSGMLGFTGQGPQALQIVATAQANREKKESAARFTQAALASMRMEAGGDWAGAERMWQQLGASYSEMLPEASKVAIKRAETITERIKQTRGVEAGLRGMQGQVAPGAEKGPLSVGSMGELATAGGRPIPPESAALAQAAELEPGGPAGARFLSRLGEQQMGPKEPAVQAPLMPTDTLKNTYLELTTQAGIAGPEAQRLLLSRDPVDVERAGGYLGAAAKLLQTRAVEVAGQKALTEAVNRLEGQFVGRLGERARGFMHKQTFEPPSPAMFEKDAVAAGYIPISPGRVQAVGQGRTVKRLLDEIERLINDNPDWFPPQAGGPGPLTYAITLSSLPGAGRFSPALGELSSLRIGMPAAAKAFGDVANVAVAEREITQEALGLVPSYREVALARLELIRGLVNESLAAAGFPALPAEPKGPRRPGITRRPN